jgi:predicted ArsR family transcriptional regulator
LAVACPLFDRHIQQPSHDLNKKPKDTWQWSTSMQNRFNIADKAAAAIFASARQRQIVQTLIGAELTLSALARETQTPLNLLHYHIAKGIRLGLVEVVRQTQRAGRPVKYYRATARDFFVPAELIVTLPGTGLAQQLRAALDQSLTRSLRGISFTHDSQAPRAHLIRDKVERAAALELWLDVGLSRADADDLAAELQAVVDRFRSRQSVTEPRYLVHLAMVRKPN